jgi:arsenate reductase
VQGILADKGIEADYVRYLDDTPGRAEIEAVLAKLGTDDPRTIVRTGEAVYKELNLAGADRDMLLDAMVANPIIIERPIVIRGDRAVVGRPPENVLGLL